MAQVLFYYAAMIAIQKIPHSASRLPGPAQQDARESFETKGRIDRPDAAASAPEPATPRRRSPLLDQVRAELRVNHYAYSTEIYTHVVRKGPLGVPSPADRLNLPDRHSADSPAPAIESARAPSSSSGYLPQAAASVPVAAPEPGSRADACTAAVVHMAQSPQSPDRSGAPLRPWRRQFAAWIKALAAVLAVAVPHRRGP